MLLVVKATLKAVAVEKALAVGYEGDISGEEAHIYALVNPPSPAENDSMQGYGSYGILQFSQPKKAKLSEDLDIDDNVLGIFPVLHHKLPSDA